MGVEKEIITEGNGDFPRPGQTVVVHYIGTLTNGKKFDSSRDKGRPFKFKLGTGQVIRGWDDGVSQPRGTRYESANYGIMFTIDAHSQKVHTKLYKIPKMKIGERAKLTCSPDYAYGSKGVGGVIPPNATLLFDVELLGVE